jgi:hypothetical protein
MKKDEIKNLGKREKLLIKATKIGIPSTEIPAYLEFLEMKRVQNQELLNKALDTLKDVEAMYNEAKAEVNMLQDKQGNYDRSYQQVLTFKNNPNAEELSFYERPKELRPMSSRKLIPVTTPSNTTPKVEEEPEVEPKKRAASIKWIDLAKETLKKRDHFMELRDLIKAIMNDNPVEKQQARMRYKGEGTALKLIGKSFQSHAALANSRKRKDLEQIIVYYEGKYGLKEWVDSDGRPLPKYLKDFIGITPITKETHKNLVHSS